MGRGYSKSLGVFFPTATVERFAGEQAGELITPPQRLWNGSPTRLVIPASTKPIKLFPNQMLLSSMMLEGDLANVAAIAIGNQNEQVTPAVPGFSASTMFTLDPGENAMVWTDEEDEIFDAGVWYAIHPAPVTQYLNITFWTERSL